MDSKVGSFFIRRQNTFIKIIFVCAAILNIFLIDNLMKGLFITLAVAIVICVDFNIIKTWFKLLLRMLPLFSSILLLSIIFNISFIKQSLLIIKIVNLLLVSVFLIEVFDPISMLNKTKSNNGLILFLMSSMAYIQKLFDSFDNIDKSDDHLITSISKVIRKIRVEDLTISEEHSSSVIGFTKSKLFFINLYGIAMISIQILSAIVVEVCHVI